MIEDCDICFTGQKGPVDNSVDDSMIEDCDKCFTGQKGPVDNSVDD